MGAILAKEDGESIDLKSDAPSKPKIILSDEEKYRLLVKKFIALVDTPTGDDGKLKRHLLLQNMEELYDRSAVRIIEDEPEQNYDDIIEEQMVFCTLVNLKFELFRYKHVEPGCMETYCRFSHNDDEDFEIAGTHYYNDDCKIYKSIAMRSLKRKAPGQVTADKTARITSSQTERQFGKKVHELPSIVNGKLMVDGMIPVRLSYEFLRINLLCRAIGRRVPLGNRRVVELRDSKDRPYAKGAKFLVRSSLKRKTLTLCSGDKTEPLALCEKKRNESHITISGLRQLIPGDHAYSDPKMETLALDNGNSQVTAFYPWMRFTWGREFVGKHAFGIVYILTDYDGEESLLVNNENIEGYSGRTNDTKVAFEPLYKVEERVENGQGNQKKKKTVTMSVNDYYHGERVAMIRKYEGSSPIADTGDDRDATVEVAPGVDPAVILAIAACLKNICHQ